MTEFKILEEHINLAKQNVGNRPGGANLHSFVELENGLVLLYKGDGEREDDSKEYIECIDRVVAEGINTPKVYDKKKIDEKDVLLLEEKAKGKNQDYFKGYEIDMSKPFDVKEVVDNYLSILNEFFEELKIRSEAPQEHYDKFIDDYIKLQKMKVSIDQKTSNFFYDSNIGFSFIDLDISNHESELGDSDILAFFEVPIILLPVMEFRVPVYMDNVNGSYDIVSFFPKDKVDIYVKYKRKIYDKVKLALSKRNINYDYVPDYSCPYKATGANEFYLRILEISEDRENFCNSVFKKIESEKAQSEKNRISYEEAEKKLPILEKVQEEMNCINLLGVFDLINIEANIEFIKSRVEYYNNMLPELDEEELQLALDEIKEYELKKKVLEKVLSVINENKVDFGSNIKKS